MVEKRRRKRGAPAHDEYRSRAKEEFDVDDDDDTGGEDEAEETEAPRRRGGGGSMAAKGGAGWDAFKGLGSSKGAGRPDRLKLELDGPPVLVKFLDDEPFAVYQRHWVQEMPKGKKKSFVAPDNDADNPLLAVGHEPETRVCFNVAVVWTESGEGVGKVLVLDAPAGLAATLRDLNDHERKGPLSKEYFEIAMFRQNNGFTAYSVDFVKGRDLREEFEIDPLSDDDLDALEAEAYEYEDYVDEVDIPGMKEAADILLGEDGEDDEPSTPARRRRR